NPAPPVTTQVLISIRQGTRPLEVDAAIGGPWAPCFRRNGALKGASVHVGYRIAKVPVHKRRFRSGWPEPALVAGRALKAREGLFSVWRARSSSYAAAGASGRSRCSPWP